MIRAGKYQLGTVGIEVKDEVGGRQAILVAGKAFTFNENGYLIEEAPDPELLVKSVAVDSQLVAEEIEPRHDTGSKRK